MEEVLVTSVNAGGSGSEDRFAENATLNFVKLKITYTPQQLDGSAGVIIGPIGWHISANTKL
jgi:hypothetical protein